MRCVNSLLASMMVLLLAGCGFQLRDEVRLPARLATVHLDIADLYSPLKRDLRAALERAGAKLAASAGKGIASVRIPVNAVTVEVLTVGGTARVQEYLIRRTVELEVLDAAGKTLLEKTRIELTRDYSFDETQALGAQAEQDLIKQELDRDMVQQILRRIEALN
jgi:LPS-assembly lipoprotein